MAKNDKLIVAFLVSMGLFSATQATQYVETLSNQDKVNLTTVVKDASGIKLAVGDMVAVANTNAKTRE